MKKLDLKSLLTIAVMITLCILTILSFVYVMINNDNIDLFRIIFALFSVAVTSMLTYYYTRKANGNTIDIREEENEIETREEQ